MGTRRRETDLISNSAVKVDSHPLVLSKESVEKLEIHLCMLLAFLILLLAFLIESVLGHSWVGPFPDSEVKK